MVKQGKRHCNGYIVERCHLALPDQAKPQCVHALLQKQAGAWTLTVLVTFYGYADGMSGRHCLNVGLHISNEVTQTTGDYAGCCCDHESKGVGGEGVLGWLPGLEPPCSALASALSQICTNALAS